MRNLLEDLKPFIAALAGLSLLINLLFLVPSIYMLQVFDRVLPSSSQETLIVLLLGAGVALALMYALDYLRSRLQGVLGSIVEERLAPPVVQTLVEKAARASRTRSPASVRDVTALRNIFSSNALAALLDAPWAPVYLLVIWCFHPILGIAATISSATMLALAWLNDRLSRRSLDGLQQDGRRAGQYVESSMRNAEVLQALGMTERLLARWRILQDRASAVQTRASRTTAAFTSASKVLRQAIQIVMLSLGAYLVLTQQGSPGIMIATTVLLGRAIQPIEQLVGSWRALSDARAAFERLRTLIAGFAAAEPHMPLSRPQGHVLVDNVAFRAPQSDSAIVSGISFALAPGEALAVVGPSAAGKSTLARLLTGIWKPTTGSARLDGADVAYGLRETLGPWVGYVPQDVELFDGTVAENIARLEEVDSDKVIAAARRAHVHELILGLREGYDTQVGEQGSRLSPGQRQRIALARALYGDPRLVVLDEPNSNLDGEGENALALAMQRLREAGVTSILITHRPSLIAHVDKILVLAEGRVQHFGPAQQVLRALQQQAQAMVDGKAA
jgi:ATP-binding cassette subfamily C exporter for protease/lipase/ATP-binding cassette subfamily C protein EexD